MLEPASPGGTVGLPTAGDGRAGRRRRARRLAALLALVAGGSMAAWRLAAPGVVRAARLGLAERAVAAGRLGDAEARLDALISEEPRDPRPRLLRARVARRIGRITEAEEELQRAVEVGLPIEDGLREHALLRAGHDLPGASPSLRRLLQARPDDEEVRRALAGGAARIDR